MMPEIWNCLNKWNGDRVATIVQENICNIKIYRPFNQLCPVSVSIKLLRPYLINNFI